MLPSLAQLLPIAVAVALSSVPITATILILLSPKRKYSAIPFLIGWVVGMAGVVVVAVVGASFLPARPLRGSQRAIAIGQIIVGLAILVVAVLSFRRPSGARSGTGSGWLDRVGRMGPATALGLAVVLNLRPKGLLLGVAAGLAVAAASLDPGRTVAVVAVYTAIASCTVTVPIALTLVAPAWAEPRLVSARDWLNHTSARITSVVLLVVGLVIVGVGISGL
jgi:hypothetical protein